MYFRTAGAGQGPINPRKMQRGRCPVCVFQCKMIQFPATGRGLLCEAGVHSLRPPVQDHPVSCHWSKVVTTRWFGSPFSNSRTCNKF
ncbi:hypothetical protein E2C01_052962 [Portunus trituberculatus]|uniref:Uncharacterized protein n=1 Tax=Portunus trituberculatus TaxID=210409 RepID=A0A5B7GMW9_PORTR|nr:hypothetical protein [Portunus trituberculatus]